MSTEWVRGERRSTILRSDGSSFAVTVPANGMDECTDGARWPYRWIHGDSGPHAPLGLTRLQHAVMGLPDEHSTEPRRTEPEPQYRS